MAKRRKKWNEDTYHKLLNEGRGQGTGADYKPWITIHDVPSKGIVSRIQGKTTGRIHHLLSRLEEYYFLYLDDSPDISDIREQFPLRLSETLEIASRLNTRHPHPPGSSFPNVMTTDFLITTSSGDLVARTVKPSSELSGETVLRKFEIEYLYWNERGIDWKIVTEKEISEAYARNVLWLRSGQDISDLIPDTCIREHAITCFIQLYRNTAYSFPCIIIAVEELCNLPNGTAIAILKHLISNGVISVDMFKKINPAAYRPGNLMEDCHE